jgi:hypothetical protein
MAAQVLMYGVGAFAAFVAACFVLAVAAVASSRPRLPKGNRYVGQWLK